jgi:hypothetical protein
MGNTYWVGGVEYQDGHPVIPSGVDMSHETNPNMDLTGWSLPTPPTPPAPSAPSAPAQPSDNPPTPTPPYNPWQTSVTYTAPIGIKQADPDIVVFNDEAMSPELMVQLFFEELGAVELANVSRSDIIDGILVSYNPIANLSWLRQKYNPNNIIAIANPEGASLADSHIDLFSRGVHEPYLDEDGNLVIEIDTLLSKETIEVSFITDGIIDRITI